MESKITVNRTLTAVSMAAARSRNARSQLQVVNVRGDGSVEAADGFIAAWSPAMVTDGAAGMYALPEIDAARKQLGRGQKGQKFTAVLGSRVDGEVGAFPNFRNLVSSVDHTNPDDASTVTLAPEYLATLAKMAKEVGAMGVTFSIEAKTRAIRFTIEQPDKSEQPPIFGLLMPMLKYDLAKWMWPPTSDDVA